jgi:deoxyribonuclease NucA/NucB
VLIRLPWRGGVVALAAAILLIPASAPASADTGAPAPARSAAVQLPESGTPKTCTEVLAHPKQQKARTVLCRDTQAKRLAPGQLKDEAQQLGGAKPRARAGLAAVDCPPYRLETNRLQSCYLGEFAFRVVLVPSGRVIGTGAIIQVAYGYLDNRSRSMEHEVRLALHKATGVVRAGVFGTVRIGCSSSCTPKVTPPPQYLRYRTTGYDSFRALTESPGTSTDYPDPVASLTVQTSAPNPLEDQIGPRPDVRCDSTPRVGPNTGGCVYHLFKPTYELSTLNSDVEEVAWHVWWAQKNLKTAWGREGYGPPLTRTRDRQLIRDNRTEACRAAPSPRPPGKSCDEYPFATTHEGASKNPDFSWHMIDATQNTKEGRDYRRPWYTANRMLENDKFWVRVVLPPGGAAAAPDWLTRGKH